MCHRPAYLQTWHRADYIQIWQREINWFCKAEQTIGVCGMWWSIGRCSTVRTIGGLLSIVCSMEQSIGKLGCRGRRRASPPFLESKLESKLFAVHLFSKTSKWYNFIVWAVRHLKESREELCLASFLWGKLSQTIVCNLSCQNAGKCISGTIILKFSGVLDCSAVQTFTNLPPAIWGQHNLWMGSEDWTLKSILKEKTEHELRK